MDNVVFVAVIYARKHLLHQHSGVFFAEFAALEDLVEEFASLAKSNNNLRR
jgi:hypothetical protein